MFFPWIFSHAIKVLASGRNNYFFLFHEIEVTMYQVVKNKLDMKLKVCSDAVNSNQQKYFLNLAMAIFSQVFFFFLLFMNISLIRKQSIIFLKSDIWSFHISIVGFFFLLFQSCVFFFFKYDAQYDCCDEGNREDPFEKRKKIK